MSAYDDFLDDLYGVTRFGNLPVPPIRASEAIRKLRPGAYMGTLYDMYTGAMRGQLTDETGE